MTRHQVLLVGEPTPAAAAAQDALAAEGIPTTVMPPAAIGRNIRFGATPPDVIFVSASVPVTAVRSLVSRIEANSRHRPIVVAYADPDPEALEAHVAAGFDHLVPPFLPFLLRSRLSSGHERRMLSMRMEEVEQTAHLVKYERELQIGQEIQGGFLPEDIPRPRGWDIDVRFRPAREVAGDFYDAFELVNGRRFGFIVADVCDKGVGAALFMALIRSLLRHTACHPGSTSMVGVDVKWAEPGDEVDEAARSLATSAGVLPLLNAVAGTDNYLVSNHLAQGYFATLFFGVLDPVTGSLVYINCGHNPPVLARSTGERFQLVPTAPALGMLPGSTFRLGRAQLDRGDTLFLYTDGVTEARDTEGRFFTEERMNEVIERRPAGASLLIDAMDASVRSFVGTADPFDDITMMALHRMADARPARRRIRAGAR